MGYTKTLMEMAYLPPYISLGRTILKSQWTMTGIKIRSYHVLQAHNIPIYTPHKAMVIELAEA